LKRCYSHLGRAISGQEIFVMNAAGTNMRQLTNNDRTSGIIGIVMIIVGLNS